MKLMDVPLGLLINFHQPKLINGVHRLILPVPTDKTGILKEATERLYPKSLFPPPATPKL